MSIADMNQKAHQQNLKVFQLERVSTGLLNTEKYFTAGLKIQG